MLTKTTTFILVYCELFFISKVSCSFINLNKYIDAFPPTYFVRVHTDKLSSENLGSSKVPLTMLSYKNSIDVFNSSAEWCKFFPVWRNFIGSRTQNTLNLIFRNITKCYTRSARNPRSSPIDPCLFMNVVHGKIKDKRSEYSLCDVSGVRMHTLIIADRREYHSFKKHSAIFLRNPDVEAYPNAVLIFNSNIRNSLTIVCAFKFRERERFLYCDRVVQVSEAFLRKISVSNVAWYVANELNVPKTLDSNFSDLWEIYSFKNSLDEILLIDSVRRANESITKFGSISRVSRRKQWSGPSVSGQIVLLANEKTKFLTCFSKQFVKFEMYAKPFRIEVWVSILFCCFLIGTFISLYNMKLKLSKSFSPYFFFISTLFEEPYSVPSALWNNRVFKTVTVTWLLTAMVFTNLYIGLMISDVTSPLQRERLVSFDQVLETEIMYEKLSGLGQNIMHYWLDNYTYSTSEDGSNFKANLDRVKCNVDFDYQGYKPRYMQFESQEYFSLLKKPMEDCGETGLSVTAQKVLLRHPWMYSEFRKLEMELLLLPSFKFNKLYKHRAFAFFAPRNRHCPRDPELPNKHERTLKFYMAAAVEKELVACNRSIFMGDANELKYELSYLTTNYPAKGFYMPDDTFENGGSSPVLWEFMRAGMSKVPLYFKLLIESGIHEGITGIRMHKHYLMRRNGTKLIQVAMSSEFNVGMSGSIQTIFFILVFILTIAAFTFTIEVIIKFYLNSNSIHF
jgi:hypothetical protein